MMKYKILEAKFIYDLQKDINKYGSDGWKLVNCWSMVDCAYMKFFAAMEKSDVA